MDVPPCFDVVMNTYAELLQAFQIAVEHGLWKSEFGDGSADHATGVGMHFEDLNRATGQCQFRCRGHAAGTGADDRYFQILMLWMGTQIRLGFLIHNEALDLANRQRFVEMRADTGGLTQVVANPSQGGGNRVVGHGQAQRFTIFTFLHCFHILRHFLVNRTTVNTGCLDTIKQTQLTPGLATRCQERGFLQLALITCLFCVAAQVSPVVYLLESISDRFNILEQTHIAAGF